MTMYAENFRPGEFLREELEARHWTQNDLANILGKSARLVSEVINGKRSITPETAKALGSAFDTSAEYWLRLENSWQLSRLADSDDDVPRRARLYDRFPVNEIIKRGWVEYSDSIEVLESRFCEFFKIERANQNPALAACFRRKNDETTPLQMAWLYRAFNIAERMPLETSFTRKSLESCFRRLKELLQEPNEIRRVPRVLSQAGIRLMVVEHFPGTDVDGVCFWLNKRSPVVVLSLRYGRIDYFWFTLFHELRHVANGDGKDSPIPIDLDLVNREPDTDIEKRADNEAAHSLIDLENMRDFIARVSPLYSTQKVIGFAHRNKVHPSIVVGRLQHLKELPYTHFRNMLIDIRKILTPNCLTDGWGYSPII